MAEYTKERLVSEIETLEHFATNLKWTNVRGAQSLIFAADAMRELLASKEREPDFYVVVTSVGVRQSFLKNRAEAEHIIKQPFHEGYSLEAAYFEPLEVK